MGGDAMSRDDYTVTKDDVRSNFKHARGLMRAADDIMKQTQPDLDDMQAIANELIACVATFAEYVEQRIEAHTISS